MSFARAFLSKLGLIASPESITDDYGIRLDRLGAREAARATRAEVFRYNGALREI